ncbi:MAG: GIY-YIG nuclease family protein [Patescibacteria group bacterium]|nr:GIY-YIG nuclease family protein [Patescibacteria group bacterium]
MEKFKYLKKENSSDLPKETGVYVFKNREKILYIGKANNINVRVKSHFRQSTNRDDLFVNNAEKIGYIKTGSEIEALILEANLIKRYRPKYNIMWRDDKYFSYAGVTKERLPRVFKTHRPKQQAISYKLPATYIGPFIDSFALKKTLKLLRRIFPYYTSKNHPDKLCTWCQINLCPGPNPNEEEYKKSIKNLIFILKGKSKTVFKELKNQMKITSNKQDYERAGKIRDQLLALERILSHAKVFRALEKEEKEWRKTEKELKKIIKTKKSISRIEAYDISNIQGQKATGSMVVFINGKPDGNFYRRFKIKISGKPNDVAMIKEVLERRFKHPEWTLPDLILIDGGKAQLNAALKIKEQEEVDRNMKVVSLAKRENKLYIEGQKRYLLLKNLPREISNLTLQLRDEAHRFAITYHKKLREKELLS